MPRDADSEVYSSSDEDSDMGELDADFLQTLAKIKQRDPAIYDSSHRLFDAGGNSQDESEASDGADQGLLPGSSEMDHKSKPKFLRQVLAEQALQGSYESDEEGTGKQTLRPQTYHEEQFAVKDAFLQAADAAGDGVDGGEFGHVLSKRSGRTAGPTAASGHADEAVVKELLAQCFGSEQQTQDSSDAFLHDYVQRQAWRPDADEASPPPEEAAPNDLDADLEHTEQAERFEAKFNFRFEEPGSAHTITYPREMEGTVRKKDERRKLARQRKALRQEEEERRLAEEAKRLRKAGRRAKAAGQQTLTKQHPDSVDPADQVAALREAAGAAGPDEQRLLAMIADEDFDPDAYDSAMASAFDGGYYEVQEDFAGGNNDNEWSAEGSQEEADDADQAAAAAQPPEVSSDSEGDEEGMLPAIRDGGFRYRKVPKADYGLSVEEMLTMDPKELSQVVSVKRLAPYRNDRHAARPNWQKMQELRDQKAASAAARKPRSSKTKHKLRSHEKAALYVQEAAQGSGRLPPSAADKSGGKPGSNSGGKHNAQKLSGARKPGSNIGDRKTTKDRSSKTNDSVPAVSSPAAGPKPGRQPTEADSSNGAAPAMAADKVASRKAREQERRLQSYSKLTLRKDGPSANSKKRSAAQAQVTKGEEDGGGSGLGKQAKKRLKRTAKRAAARATTDQA